MKKIIYPKVMGVCGNDRFGVERALRLVEEAAIKYPADVYMLGEVVHNEVVAKRYVDELGVKMVDDINLIPDGATLIIRAHGVGPDTYVQAKRKNLIVVDASCPIVAAVHRRVIDLAQQGKKIIYIASEITHDEAVGVAGEILDSVTLITISELKLLEIEEPDKTVVVTQTTLAVEEIESALTALKMRYPTITIEKHICTATTERQRGVDEMKARGAQAIVVIGSSTSSNTKRLREVAQAKGLAAWLVNNVTEIPDKELSNYDVVGVTAGASVPRWLSDPIIERLEHLREKWS